MEAVYEALDELCVNAIRTLSMDAIQAANSGHPGITMGAAPMAYVLWTRHLRHDPERPDWPDRDRFVLSAGHGSALLYALLHLCGYALSLDDLKRFRQLGSPTPGHPEYGATPGVEATTGPLGQGCANAVGMALAERALAHRFNRPGTPIVDHHTFALMGDGDMMEGLSGEAASLAGHLGLGRLICLYDANDVCLDGPTEMTFTEDVGGRYAAYGWQVIDVEKGDTDLDAIDRALRAAKAETERPSLIIVHTTIGYGSPNKAGSAAAHGSPLGEEELRAAKRQLGWEHEASFVTPEAVAGRFGGVRREGARRSADWRARLETWAGEHGALASEWEAASSGTLPADFDAELPTWEAGEKVATRAAGGVVLNALARRLPGLMGGDADLSCSTKSALAEAGSFDGRSGAGRNIHFGVREHAMGAIVNGMAYHGGLRAYASTFFVFSDYMRPSLRVAALAGLPVLYIWTHDSVAVGEDGPTHQPVEQLAGLRAMPGFRLWRPCDANETARAWCAALRASDGPAALVLSRQKLPVLEATETPGAAEGFERGAYVLSEAAGGAARGVLIGTGAEVHLALAAQAQLEAEGLPVRVVSMPCWEVFEEQDQAWRDAVLPPELTARVSVEAGATFGWRRWVGDAGETIGIDRFGLSAPGGVVLETLGLTAARVAEALRGLLR